MKNKIISFLLAVAVLMSSYYPALATGDGNVDSGSGGMGVGTENYHWSPGNDGVRITVIDAATGAPVGRPQDYTNIIPPAGMSYFDHKTKIEYLNGASLTLRYGDYAYKNPVPPLPRIVSDSTGNANLEAIKQYFCSEGAALMVSNDFGINFDMLTNGDYKLFIEPIAYFKYAGFNVGMTAHEAALYDTELGGAMRSYMTSLTHQNLPLSMFLERPDLGLPAYSGVSTGWQTNATIITYLGMGIISYTDVEYEDEDNVEYTIEYRPNTEVITAVTLSSSAEINYHSSATVTFHILGRAYNMSGVVMPAGGSQIVWCKWTTPATEQMVTISVATNKGVLSENQVAAKIVPLDENPPPDPKADDRNDTFSPVSSPINPERKSASWSVWWARWHENWQWVEDWQWVADVRWISNLVYIDGAGFVDYGYYYDFGQWFDFGEWQDLGWWDFFTANYHANLAAVSTIAPDEKVPTAVGSLMKSGYGINNTVTANIDSIQVEIDSHVTGAQTAVSYFPEFGYTTYWRLLDLTSRGRSSRLELKYNPFSTYNRRVHFTPVWYPNGRYDVYTWVLDAWTPVGMLSVNLTSGVSIEQSVFDDWYTNRE